MAEAENLWGTWRLVSATAVDDAGKPLALPYGPFPMGRLVLTREGRMMAILCDGRETMPAGETRAYSSYCGAYRIEDDRLITRVDAAAISERIGGDEVRRIARRDGLLVLHPPRRAGGEQRELIWVRCSDL